MGNAAAVADARGVIRVSLGRFIVVVDIISVLIVISGGSRVRNRFALRLEIGGHIMTVSTLNRIGSSVVALALAVMPAAAGAAVQTEDFTSDPGWTGVGNTTNGNTFGYKGTSNAGGAAGEAGGDFVAHTAGTDYYADTTLGGTLSQQNVLSASGRFTVAQTPNVNDGQFEIGWFDTTPSSLFDNGPFEGIVMHIREQTTTTYRVNVRVGDQRSNASDIPLNVNTDYRFELSYDPNALGAGLGQARIDIFDASNNFLVFNDTPSFSSTGTPWQMNAFGMLTADTTADTDSGEGYFDDLEYTIAAVPEPASLTLMGLSALALVRRRRQRNGL
jgi:hypothetical protein